MDFCFGFSPVKRKRLQAFTGTRVAPIRVWSRRLPSDSRLFVWGALDVPARLQTDGVSVLRVEDGFLRSVGLGAAFAPPVSWTFDSQGLHHWGHSPTDLETLLETRQFTDAQRESGQRILHALRLHRLSKYNLPSSCAWDGVDSLRAHPGRKVLVIGQVADDAALRGIRSSVRTNMELLAQVRGRYPGAFVAYKRHPDVTAGLRRGADGDANQWADAVIEGVGMHDALQGFDEVHVLNSLSGFEALIAGKRVVCHAQPFYAGWGLTEDLQPFPRRSRKLELSELVYGALSLYPSYAHPDTGAVMDVFGAIDYLARVRAQPTAVIGHAGVHMGRLYGLLRRWRFAG
jgi:capsular polysaccharide export protein